MENLALKIKIAVLWIFLAVAPGARWTLFLYEPDAIQRVTSGELWMGMDPAGRLAGFSIDALNYLVPLLMAFLSVTLKDLANRRVNLVMGGVFTFLNIFYLIVCPIIHIFNKPLVHQLLIAGSTVVVAILIVWYAWKWPREKG